MKLNKLKLKQGNPRFIKDDRFNDLVRSIRQMPKMLELRPLIYDPDTMELLAGNMRFRALQELDYKEIPDNWATPANQLSEEEKRRFVIVDNLGFGEWDMDIIANEWNEEELKDWGFDYNFPDSIEEKIDEPEEENASLSMVVSAKDPHEYAELFAELQERGFNVKVKS